jgi:hypothetical protein
MSELLVADQEPSAPIGASSAKKSPAEPAMLALKSCLRKTEHGCVRGILWAEQLAVRSDGTNVLSNLEFGRTLCELEEEAMKVAEHQRQAKELKEYLRKLVIWMDMRHKENAKPTQKSRLPWIRRHNW